MTEERYRERETVIVREGSETPNAPEIATAAYAMLVECRALRSALSETRCALREFGRHGDHCSAFWDARQACSCGLAALLPAGGGTDG
jgi:hypothetical protein